MLALNRSKLLSKLVFAALIAIASLAWSSGCFAQGGDNGGGNQGGGNQGGGNQGGNGGVVTNPGVTGGGNQGVTGDQSNVSPDDGIVEPDASLDLGGDPTDRRNQGFIGTTGERIGTQGYVGAGSTIVGPELDPDSGATYGGGVNSNARGENGSANPTVPTGNRSGFQAAQPNGVTIIRGARAVRARLVPRFSAPTLAPETVANRFNSVMARQPSQVAVAGRFSISVVNKTATLRGTVDNADQARQIVQQLRLQPGVYKIVNQLQVLN